MTKSPTFYHSHTITLLSHDNDIQIIMREDYDDNQAQEGGNKNNQGDKQLLIHLRAIAGET